MYDRNELLDRIDKEEQTEKYFEIYKYLKKAEKKKLKSCEMEYTDLSFSDFVKYYEAHEFEIKSQIEKYKKEIAKIQKEKKKIYNQNFLEKNKDTILEYRKKYYKDHMEELKEYNRKQARNNREKRSDYAAKWNKNNPEKRKEYNKKYRLEHPGYWKNRGK